MDLINWSLNATDSIFSTRRTGQGEPSCPDGTFAAGYMMDFWKEWRVVCQSILSVEDVEDVYLIGIMITGFLLFGAGSILIYCKVQKALAALIGMLSTIEETGRAVNTQTQAIYELNRKLDAIGSQIRMMDTNLEKLLVRLTEMGYQIRMIGTTLREPQD